MTATPFRIVFILYPRLTQLDFTGPFEVLARLPGAEVIVASKDGGELKADSGLAFAGLTRLAEIPGCDMICIPGGAGQVEAMQDADFMREVRRLGETATYLTSVCTGSLILGAAGFLAGKRAACHWAYRDLLALFGAVPDPARVVRDGDVITGGGVTAGIDFALTVVSELYGAELAQGIQLGIEYAPEPPFNAGRPETAPAPLVASVRERLAGLLERREQLIRERLTHA